MGSVKRAINQRHYGVNKIDFIRQALSGYPGGSAIASEMLQNADDAGATEMQITFSPEALWVWNNSAFEEKDFVNIMEIASGQKRNEEGQIGTWGTGFLSVFHLTDSPELQSAGEHYTFDPTKDELDGFESNLPSGTLFRLPWRTEKTRLAVDLDADIWNPEKMAGLKDEIVNSIYRFILFLRHVRQIDIYEGDQQNRKLIAHAGKRKVSEKDFDRFVHECWEIEYKLTGVQARTDSWFLYRGRVPDDLMVPGIRPKDREIGLAFPVENRPWLQLNLPGTLYNFLPTPIVTGYPFQLNGAFFPDNNRKSILTDTNAHWEKNQWNRNVIKAMAGLFGCIMLHARDHLGDIRRFYEILPTSCPSEDYLQPIFNLFRDIAPENPIVFSSLKEWACPKEILIGRPASKLPELASEYLPLLPTGVPQSVRDFLNKELNREYLDWIKVVEFLRSHLRPGMDLTQAHPMINTQEKLELLYSELPRDPSPEEQAVLQNLPLALSDDGNLWPFQLGIWRANNETRELVKTGEIRFLKTQLQEAFPRLVQSLLPEFRGADIVVWMKDQDWVDGSYSLNSLPPIIVDKDHLVRLLSFISADIHNIHPSNLGQLPLIVTEDEHLVPAGSRVFFHNDADERAKLAHLGIQFVHPDWAKMEGPSQVFKWMGVLDLAPRDVIAALNDHPFDSHQMTHKELIDRLINIYAYFNRHQNNIAPADKALLLTIPLCLTQNGRLSSAATNGTHLHLPADSSYYHKALSCLDLLQLDYLIHTDTLIPAGRAFLTQILNLQQLSPEELIRDVILIHYHDPRLDDRARLQLLQYIEEQVRLLPEPKQKEIWPALREYPLVRCANDEYHRGQEIYFASPTIDAVFDQDYLYLHPDFEGTSSGEEYGYQKSIWYWFFQHLGVNEAPTGSDLVGAVCRIVQTSPPPETAIKQIEKIYNFLSREFDNNTRRYTQDPILDRLAQIPWLPSRNKPGRWYLPKDIYLRNQFNFIGDQAPILEYDEPTRQFRSFLGIPSFPSASLMARHLLALSQENRPVPDPTIYSHLGRNWDEVDNNLKQGLRTKPVIWDPQLKRYWQGEYVFTYDLSPTFGKRRGYIEPVGEAQALFRYIGANTRSPTWQDYFAVICEIANDYKTERVVDAEDLHLLKHQYHMLGEAKELENDPEKMRQLADLPVVPDQAGFLSLTKKLIIIDQEDLLDCFDPSTIPAVDIQGLTTSGYHFISQVLCVPHMSRSVRRKLINADEKDQDVNSEVKLQIRRDAFNRIALQLYPGNPDSSRSTIEKLKGIKVFSCKGITIQYVLTLQNGIEIFGHHIEGENALYDVDNNCLYVNRSPTGKSDTVQLALELEKMLFPGEKVSVVIEQLLEREPAQADNFLDSHGYPKSLTTSSITQEQIDGKIAGEIGKVGGNITDKPNIENENKSSADKASIETTEGQTNNESSSAEQEKAQQEQGQDGTRNAPDEESPEIRPNHASSEKKSDGNESARSEASIPPFTGMKRPIVPILPNHYGELEKKLGLTRASADPVGDQIANGDQVESDGEWVEKLPDNQLRTNVARFTLTFMNRSYGFFGLHSTARNLLTDRPSILSCTAPGIDEPFDLYVDYDQGIIYNQRDLPRIFEVNNIPAGGIVYLERTSGINVRLYWKHVTSQVEKVLGFELQSDGTVDEFETPVAEYPCEISEYVYRAEKRLEDMGALFQKAVGKRGIFQTICELFGEQGKVLSYPEIIRGVQKERGGAAVTSIKMILGTRPCFEDVGQGLWCFNPNNSSEPPAKKKQKQAPPSSGSQTNQALEKRGEENPENVQLPSSPSLYEKIFANITNEWAQLTTLLSPNGEDLGVHMNFFAERLVSLGQKILTDLAALSQPQPPIDQGFHALWNAILDHPADLQEHNRLAHLCAQLSKEKGVDVFVAQISQLLALTPVQERSTFYQIIQKLAERSWRTSDVPLSEALYTLLNSQGVSDYSTELTRISQHKEVLEIISLLEISSDINDRMKLLQHAWEKYPGDPLLRRTICDELVQSSNHVEKSFSDAISTNTDGVYQIFENWINNFLPLTIAWQTEDTAVTKIVNIAVRMFSFCISQLHKTDDHDYAYQAIAVASSIPLHSQYLISADEFLEAAMTVADQFEQSEDCFTAAVIIDYSISTLVKTNRSATNYLLCKAYERASHLYEVLNLLHFAKERLSSAHKLSKAEKKKTIGYGLLTLIEKRDSLGNDYQLYQEINTWRLQAESLLDRPMLQDILVRDVFEKMVATEVASILDITPPPD